MAGNRRQNSSWQMDDQARSAARERLASRQRSAGRGEPPAPSRGTSPWNPPVGGGAAPSRKRPERPAGASPWNPPTAGRAPRNAGRGRGTGGIAQGAAGIAQAARGLAGGVAGAVSSIRDMGGLLARAGIVLAVVLVALAVFFIMPITVQVDGKQVQVARSTTYQTLVDRGYFDAAPGNLLAVDGELLEEGAGNPPSVFANGQPVELGALVSEGAQVTAEAGSDLTEPSQTVQDAIPVETRVARDREAEALGVEADTFNFYNGILHIVTDPGQEGYGEVLTGEISGKTVAQPAQEMRPRIIENIHANLPDDQKLIVLTFDDGPSPNENETPGVLAVLDKHGVPGTFFMLGSEAEQYPDMAKKVADAGHQVCSHSYSHAAEHFLSATTEDDVRNQLQMAREKIGAATGTEPAYVRPPGGNVNVKAIEAAGTLADGYIGWSVDPHDYDRPGADAIAQAIVDQAAPGAVVLLHDGGGDRSQTIDALDTAIPKLKREGYTFVTLDTLIEAVLANRG